MKKILAIVGIAAATTLLYGQGTIQLYTFTGSAGGMQTNTALSSYAGGTETGGVGGPTMATANSYYYTLLISSTDPGSVNPLTAGWTVAMASNSVNTVLSPFLGVNYPAVGDMTGPNLNQSTTIENWAPSASMYFIVVGWSANLGGDWATVQAELNSGIWAANGYFGVSSEGHLASGGAAPATPTLLMGTGVGQVTPFTMYAVPVPEPTTLALAGLGGMALLAFRRKSRKS